MAPQFRPRRLRNLSKSPAAVAARRRRQDAADKLAREQRAAATAKLDSAHRTASAAMRDASPPSPPPVAPSTVPLVPAEETFADVVDRAQEASTLRSIALGKVIRAIEQREKELAELSQLRTELMRPYEKV